MGLDMYLSAKRYMWYNEDDLKEQVAKAFPDLPEGIKPKEIVLEAAYWRKANQIHKWMVDNIQGGEDNCARYCLSVEQLDELLEICSNILAEQDKEKQVALAEETLPPQSGFFFGSTEIDEGYLNDLKRTIEIINKVKKLPEGCWLYYTSSW